MSGEKTEKPTAKKLRDARREGEVARSSDFTGIAVMIGAGVTLLLTLEAMATALQTLMRSSITVALTDPAGQPLAGHLVNGLAVGARVTLPILTAAFVMAAAVAYLQVGPVFSTKPVVPDASRLDLAKGWKRMFNKDRLVDLAKNLVRLTSMILIAIAVYDAAISSVLQMPRSGLAQALPVIRGAAYDQAKFLILALIVFATIDLLWQRHKFEKDHMMSKQEVRDEHQQAEGDPHVKAQRKRLHQELAQSAGVAEVRNADAVVVNPTHVAAAIRYREEERSAPRVIASGRGARAEQIRRLARRHHVPIVRDVKLARALADLDVDQEIPEDLFEAVAEVLHFVYSLRDQ